MFRVKKEGFYAAYLNGYEIEKLYNSVKDCPNIKNILTKDFETEEGAKEFYKKEKELIVETKLNKDFKNHVDGEIIELVEITEDEVFGKTEDVIDSYLKCRFAID